MEQRIIKKSTPLNGKIINGNNRRNSNQATNLKPVNISFFSWRGNPRVYRNNINAFRISLNGERCFVCSILSFENSNFWKKDGQFVKKLISSFHYFIHFNHNFISLLFDMICKSVEWVILFMIQTKLNYHHKCYLNFQFRSFSI